MSFYQFYEMMMVEAGDIAADASGITLRKYGMGYAADFEHGGGSFKVIFTPTVRNKPQFVRDIEGRHVVEKLRGFSISFKSGEEVHPTGRSGGEAFNVYGKLLLAVKMFLDEMERSKPDEIHYIEFTGMTDMMNILYDMFYKKHLMDRYTRVSFMLFVRNDVLQHIHDATGGKSKSEVEMGQRIAKDQLEDMKKRSQEAKRLGLRAPRGSEVANADLD